MRGSPPRVHNPLWDPLTIEMGHLISKLKILQQRRSPLPGLERIVRLPDRNPKVGREGRVLVVFAYLEELGVLDGLTDSEGAFDRV